MDIKKLSLILFIVVAIADSFIYLLFRYEGHAELYQVGFQLNIATLLTFILFATFSFQSLSYRWIKVAFAFIGFLIVPPIMILAISYSLAKNGIAIIWIEISFLIVTALKIAFAILIYHRAQRPIVAQPI